MKILYGVPTSVFVRKPRVLLQEKGIEFISDPVNPMVGLSENFKSISPLGKIPVYQDEDYILADSSAICAYIDATNPYPSFYPSNPKELGKALWFEEYADTVLFQATAACYYQTILVPLYRDRAPNQEAIEIALTRNLPPVADYLEKEINDKEYLVGNKFSIADVAIVSVLLNVHLAGYAIPQVKWPNLARYLNTHFKRMSIQTCIDDFAKLPGLVSLR